MPSVRMRLLAAARIAAKGAAWLCAAAAAEGAEEAEEAEEVAKAAADSTPPAARAAAPVAVCMRVLIVSRGNIAVCSVVPAIAPAIMWP